MLASLNRQMYFFQDLCKGNSALRYPPKLFWPCFVAMDLKPEEEKAARGPYKCLQISEGWVSGGWGQALFSGAQ